MEIFLPNSEKKNFIDFLVKFDFIDFFENFGYILREKIYEIKFDKEIYEILLLIKLSYLKNNLFIYKLWENITFVRKLYFPKCSVLYKDYLEHLYSLAFSFKTFRCSTLNFTALNCTQSGHAISFYSIVCVKLPLQDEFLDNRITKRTEYDIWRYNHIFNR